MTFRSNTTNFGQLCTIQCNKDKKELLVGTSAEEVAIKCQKICSCAVKKYVNFRVTYINYVFLLFFQIFITNKYPKKRGLLWFWYEWVLKKSHVAICWQFDHMEILPLYVNNGVILNLQVLHVIEWSNLHIFSLNTV